MIRIRPELFNFKKPAAHSPYGPSSFERWQIGACPASVPLSEGIVLPREKYSDEGELAHSVAEAIFRQDYYSLPIPAEVERDVLMWEYQHPGETMAMYAHGYEYSNVIQEWMDPAKVGTILYHNLEKGLPVIVEQGVYGTGDCIIIGTKASVVIDYKYGKGKIVKGDAPQLQVYAVALWRYLENLPADYVFYSVVFQPRVSPVPQVASFTPAHMDSMFKHIWASVDESKKPGIKPNRGSHCFWCPARRTTDHTRKCPAIKNEVYEVVEGDLMNLLATTQGDIARVDNDLERRRDAAAVKALSMKSFIIDTLENLEEEYKARILAGEIIQGLKVDTEFGNRSFAIEDEKKLAEELSKRFPQLQPYKIIPETKKIKTITEIEKELKDKQALDGLTIRKGKKVLVADQEQTTKLISEMLNLI